MVHELSIPCRLYSIVKLLPPGLRWPVSSVFLVSELVKLTNAAGRKLADGLPIETLASTSCRTLFAACREHGLPVRSFGS